MASLNEAKELFSGFSIKELQEYVRESGGNPNQFFERSELVEEAARLSLAAAQQGVGGGGARGGGYPGSGGGYPPQQGGSYPGSGGGGYPAQQGGGGYPPQQNGGGYPGPGGGAGYPPQQGGGGYPPQGGPPSPWAAPPPSAGGGGPPSPWGSAAPGGGAPPNPFGAPPPNPFGAPPPGPGGGGGGPPPAAGMGPPGGGGGGAALPPWAMAPQPGGGSGGGAPPPYGAGPPPGASLFGEPQRAPAAAAGASPPPPYGAPPPGGSPYGMPPGPGGVGGGAPPPYGAPAPGGAAPPGGHYGAAGPAGGGIKKALIIGCNYPGTQAQLRGCINDAQCMEYMLKTKFHFRPENIRMLRDDTQDPSRRPTKANIIANAQWLVNGNPPGSSLLFHFSGHGSQQRDYSGEESDGMNETICPTDYKTAGQIVDNDLNRMLCNPIPAGVTLHAIIDACHSGTALDLPFRITHNYGQISWKQEYDPRRLRSHKGTAGGRAIQISAASDHQVAADTNRLSGGTHTGAATFSFIQAIEQCGANISYGDLMTRMHRVLDKGAGAMPAMPSGGGGAGGAIGGLLGMLMGGSMAGGGMSAQKGQTPVLSADQAFDLNTRLVL